MFNIISKELNVNGTICENLEKYFEFLNKFEKRNAKEFDSKNDGYRDIDQKEETDFIIKKLNMLPIHKVLSKLDFKKKLKWIMMLHVFTRVLCGMKNLFILK